jgi:hypothetical protein
MNCPDIRAALPEFVYGGLAPDARVRLEGHLEQCPDCRREAEALGQVRRLLGAGPSPESRVDLAAVYRQAAERQARRLGRWRRFALAACAACAAAVALIALSRLEIHVGQSEMVVRWGEPAAPPAPLPTPSPPVAPAPGPPPPDLAAIEDRLRTLGELTQALADDGHDRDYQRQQEIARLRQEIRQWQGLSAERLSAMQKDFDALYVAQFSSRKGVNP